MNNLRLLTRQWRADTFLAALRNTGWWLSSCTTVAGTLRSPYPEDIPMVRRYWTLPREPQL